MNFIIIVCFLCIMLVSSTLVEEERYEGDFGKLFVQEITIDYLL